jgi:hypothetical protein
MSGIVGDIPEPEGNDMIILEKILNEEQTHF